MQILAGTLDSILELMQSLNRIQVIEVKPVIGRKMYSYDAVVE